MIALLWAVGVFVYWIVGIYVAKLFTMFNRRFLNDDLDDSMGILCIFGLLWPFWLAAMVIIPAGWVCYKIACSLPGFRGN